VSDKVLEFETARAALVARLEEEERRHGELGAGVGEVKAAMDEARAPAPRPSAQAVCLLLGQRGVSRAGSVTLQRTGLCSVGDHVVCCERCAPRDDLNFSRWGSQADHSLAVLRDQVTPPPPSY
jgi:hypothetical protein